ncbi:MAG: PA0069 family radical SAM protein [Cyclobacteriaceae bacterium]|nr:PA0069 family radical SAM protein [Cyclobacteriaceae bacterium]
MIGEYEKGRGAQINTKNKFLGQEFVREHVEGIDESSSPNSKRQIIIEHPQKIISKNTSPDIPFNYSINPYQGCEHGCVYCYARNVHTYWGYSAGMDWETKIIAKPNAAKLLEKEFLKKSYLPETIILSGNTDPYQPIERQLKITRSLLEVFVRYRHPVSIITKSSLIARDIDLLSVLAKNNLVRVTFSITTLQESLRRILEPRSANATKMLDAMQKLSGAGVRVGVMTAPILPSINDQEIGEILRVAAENGATSAGYTLARFNGDVAEIFADWLTKNFPDRATKVWEKVKSFHGGNVNDSRFGRENAWRRPVCCAFQNNV